MLCTAEEEKPVRMDHPSPSRIGCWLILTASLAVAQLDAQSNPLDQARSLVESRTSADQAKSLLQQSIAADPKSGEAHFLLGQIFYAFSDFSQASDQAQKAVLLDDSKSDYHFLLGNSLSGLLDSAGMFKKMSLARQIKAEFERAIAENPKNIPARSALVEFYAQAPSIVGGSTDKAVDQAKQISALDPVEGHYAMALAYLDQKKLSDAEQEYKAAIAAAPKRAKSYVELAFVCISEKKDSEAPALFKHALDVDANYLPGYFGVARSDLLSGQNLDEAERFFKKYLTRWPEEGEPSWANAYWRLGQVYEKQGKKDLAVAEWQQALKLTPNYKPAQESLKTAGK
jgi:tetratricopeptide (TPR) repeat protein